MQLKWMTMLALGGALCCTTSSLRANDGGMVPAVRPPSDAPKPDGAQAKPGTMAPLTDAQLAERRAKMQQEMEEKLNNPPPMILQKFDADHDGRLNDAEKATAKAEMTARGEQYLADLKAGKVATPSREEMTAYYIAKLDNPTPEILKRFDTNGDGALSADEKSAAAAKIRADLAGKPGAGPGPGGKDMPKLTPDEVKAKIAEKLDNPGPEVLKRFDQDGDGKLSPTERAAATQTMTEYLSGKGEKGDKPGPK